MDVYLELKNEDAVFRMSNIIVIQIIKRGRNYIPMYTCLLTGTVITMKQIAR